MVHVLMSYLIESCFILNSFALTFHLFTRKINTFLPICILTYQYIDPASLMKRFEWVFFILNYVYSFVVFLYLRIENQVVLLVGSTSVFLPCIWWLYWISCSDLLWLVLGFSLKWSVCIILTLESTGLSSVQIFYNEWLLGATHHGIT